MKTIQIKRGQIYYADLSPVIGSEQGGMRPVLIIQNDMGNAHSPTTIVAPITSMIKKHLPTHIECKLLKDSIILCEQIKCIDKRRLKGHSLCTLDENTMARVNEAIKISLGVDC